MDNNWWVQDVARQHREQFMAEAQHERSASIANMSHISWRDRLSGWLGTLGTDHVAVGTTNATPTTKAHASR